MRATAIFWLMGPNSPEARVGPGQVDVLLRRGDGEVVADEEAAREGVVGVGGEVRDARVTGAQVELLVDEAEGLAAVVGARVVDVVAGLVRVVTHVAPHDVDGAVRADVDRGEELHVLGVVVVEDAWAGSRWRRRRSEETRKMSPSSLGLSEGRPV